mgnify:FL=1
MATYTLYAVIEEDVDGGSEVVRAFASHLDAQYYERRATVDNADRDGSYTYFTAPIVLEAVDDLPFIKF